MADKWEKLDKDQIVDELIKREEALMKRDKQIDELTIALQRQQQQMYDAFSGQSRTQAQQAQTLALLASFVTNVTATNPLRLGLPSPPSTPTNENQVIPSVNLHFTKERSTTLQQKPMQNGAKKQNDEPSSNICNVKNEVLEPEIMCLDDDFGNDSGQTNTPQINIKKSDEEVLFGESNAEEIISIPLLANYITKNRGRPTGTFKRLRVATSRIRSLKVTKNRDKLLIPHCPLQNHFTCNKTFVHRDTLKRHIKGYPHHLKNHGAKKFLEKIFTTATNVENHTQEEFMTGDQSSIAEKISGI
jgi:hypothetical protein